MSNTLEFVVYLLILAALGFLGLFIADGLKRRTTPQADELTTQFVSVSVPETIEQQPRYSVPVQNSHWFRHTFERPRRKVK